ncbi:glycosyltransferase family 4 protein [Cyanobium sp. Aljojuca 7D2]|uniref:glycosyltransferase family 4 protein n=1 Tax=Cyanobium sp. Aljojuca 7D2 TaxID=2823698 RepID=UPI0020CFDFEA|nr:glycosyltransferase family 4 protein [Cyanobium sp. Aljojuca 7D2]
MNWLNREWAWCAHETIDRYVSSRLHEPTVLLALSGSGLYAGRRAQQLGGLHICDRGSSHIRVQDQLLHQEYRRYGAEWQGIDPRSVAKEEAEYVQADWISIPSQFCLESFISKGFPADKLIKIPYGARLDRFAPSQCSHDTNAHNRVDEFRVLFVGQAGPRKGFVDLLKAFSLLQHPHKRLSLIGSLSPEAKSMLDAFSHEGVEYLGSVPNAELRGHYNRATVFVLPSIEEGFGMVMGEAMACGCPVIASMNTGAADLFTDGQEGFIVPIRSPGVIADRLQQLADEPLLRERMSWAALARVKQLGGWDAYGDAWQCFLTTHLMD